MVSNVIFEIGSLPSISYDEFRRTKKGRPQGGLMTKKTLCPPYLKRGPEPGVYRIETIFMVFVRTPLHAVSTSRFC
jgi:hypothetical protein